MPGPLTGTRTADASLLLTHETAEDRVCRAYEADRDTVYRYLVSLGIDRADAQELTQEVFLKLYLVLSKGERIHTPRAWLFTVASRLALNHWRDGSRRPFAETTDDAGALDAIVARELSPELLLLQREQMAALHEATRQLSRQQQICLHLRGEGFRYQAIADILGVGVPTVAEHLRRAITRLRTVIHG